MFINAATIDDYLVAYALPEAAPATVTPPAPR
jgi:hypothetical protein